MRINYEIPDDVGQIFKEFLLISKDDDQNVGQHMALYIADEAKCKLFEQWHRMSWEMHGGRGGSKKTQEEVESKIDILEKFCREMIRQTISGALTVKRRKAKEKKL